LSIAFEASTLTTDALSGCHSGTLHFISLLCRLKFSTDDGHSSGTEGLVVTSI